MPVQTLANTQWKLNSTVSLDELWSYDIYGNVVDSLSRAFKRLYVYKDSRDRLYLEATGISGGSIRFTSFSNGTAYPVSYYDGFIIIGGEDCENQNLIAWLTENATQQDLIFKARKVAFEQTANAIRNKGNTSAALSWSSDTGFKPAIDAIVFGADATAEPFEVKSGAVFYGNNARKVGTVENANGRSF